MAKPVWQFLVAVSSSLAALYWYSLGYHQLALGVLIVQNILWATAAAGYRHIYREAEAGRS